MIKVDLFGDTTYNGFIKKIGIKRVVILCAIELILFRSKIKVL